MESSTQFFRPMIRKNDLVGKGVMPQFHMRPSSRNDIPAIFCRMRKASEHFTKVNFYLLLYKKENTNSSQYANEKSEQRCFKRIGTFKMVFSLNLSLNTSHRLVNLMSLSRLEESWPKGTCTNTLHLR